MLQRYLQFKKYNAYLHFLRYLSHFLDFKKIKKTFFLKTHKPHVSKNQTS